MWKLIAFLTAGFLFFGAHASAELPFPETQRIHDRTLVLNGTGIRTATIFSVRVYEAALYLEKRNSDPEAIIAAPEWKQLRMKFLREVSLDKLQDAFREGIEKNAHAPEMVADKTATFLALLRDVKDGDSLVLSFLGDHLIVEHNTEQLGEVSSPQFLEALISVWLGPKPPNEELKRGILGLKS